MMRNKEHPVRGQTIWITKWVLTHGIIELPVEDPRYCDKSQVGVLIQPSSPLYKAHLGMRAGPTGPDRIYYIFKPDWHANKDDAVKRAAKKFKARINKIQKELSDLLDLQAALNRI